MPTDPPVLPVAEAAARAAGAVLRDGQRRPKEVVSKGRTDIVTWADGAAQVAIVEVIAAAFPDDRVVGEEGTVGDPSAARTWIVDPLDGTSNYAHGIPFFCVSVAVRETDGPLLAGVVYDPLRDECFDAVRGGGARRNGRAIRVSEAKTVATALLATGFAYDVHDDARDNLAEFARATKVAGGIRRDGSAALDLCYVACGRFDGYWELKLHPWDVAAGILIVEEAGGRVTDLAGAAVPASGREIVSSNGAIHHELLRVLAGEA
jgi:myo-inositol-1(or 4)-monophosphatase